jgi:NAD(P)-dependent dehydrogenase (short-subunit alcohol dehydrogenase family)
MGRLEGKVIVVTGASSGFGRGMSLAFAQEGAKVIASDIHEEANTGGFEADSSITTVQEIDKNGGQAVYIQSDVTNAGQVDDLIASAVNTYGQLDVMVNNAGVYRRDKRIHEFSAEDLYACFDVNCKGSFFGAQSAVKQFLTQGDGGTIINLVSTAGLQGHPWQSVYNISKGAQAQLTRCLAIEYGKDGIRTNGICPTFAKTSLTRTLYDDKSFDEAFVESVPLKRWGEVDDVASLAVFLASEESSYIHGDLIRIDGGETLCRYSV